MDLEILKIASNSENHKKLKKHTHYSKLNNPICGDEMQISLIVKNEKITDFAYQCKSCIYCQASVSLLSRKSINKTIINIKNLINLAETFFDKSESNLPKDWIAFNKILNINNLPRKECILLPFKALTKALKSYK